MAQTTTQTKADRQTAARKAAATRKGKSAAESARYARTEAKSAVSHFGNAVQATGEAAVKAVQSIFTRATAPVARG